MSSKVQFSIDTKKITDSIYVKAMIVYLAVVTVVDGRKEEPTFYNSILIKTVIYTVLFVSLVGMDLGNSALSALGLSLITFFFIDKA